MKEIKLKFYDITYLPDCNKIFVDYDIGDNKGFTKQDLLDMLKLFEEQEQEKE